MRAHPLSLNHLSTDNPRPRMSSRTDPPNSSRAMAFSRVSSRTNSLVVASWAK